MPVTELMEQNVEALRDELRSTRYRRGQHRHQHRQHRQHRQDLEDWADSLGRHRDRIHTKELTERDIRQMKDDFPTFAHKFAPHGGETPARSRVSWMNWQPGCKTRSKAGGTNETICD